MLRAISAILTGSSIRLVAPITLVERTTLSVLNSTILATPWRTPASSTRDAGSPQPNARLLGNNSVILCDNTIDESSMRAYADAVRTCLRACSRESVSPLPAHAP